MFLGQAQRRTFREVDIVPVGDYSVEAVVAAAQLNDHEDATVLAREGEALGPGIQAEDRVLEKCR